MTPHFHALGNAQGDNPLRQHSCRLLGFSRLLLDAGGRWQGVVEADREAVLVVLSGTARVTVGDTCFERIGARPNVFAGNPHSIYLPRGARYTVEALGAFDAALVSAPSQLDTEPYEIRPADVRTGTWGTLNYTRQFREILVEPDGRPASSLIVGETITPSGNWSTFPPHKHEGVDGEALHEEMYYFRVSAPEGFGFLRHYGSAGEFDDTHVVRDNTLASLPHGYHTYVGAPGTQSYYLWFLAGDTRRQAVKADPAHAWTQKLVGMV